MLQRVAILVVGVCCALALGSVPDSIVRAATTSDGKWSLTIDEWPSSQFTAESLQQLEEFYEKLSAPGPCRCSYVGNYGGTFEPESENEATVFIRLADDIDESGVAAAGPMIHPLGCQGSDYNFVWAFFGYESPQQLISDIELYPESTNFFWSLVDFQFQAGTIPAFVGPNGPESEAPRVWAVTLSAAPEPASGSICLLALTLLGIQWRRRR